ncbi:MAG: hypothetical protein RLZZ262_883 [Bacteroidota bacterium]|jgi:predicted acetyltransferase
MANRKDANHQIVYSILPMEQIIYQKATVRDTADLVESRLLFAKELSNDYTDESIKQLRIQLTEYFAAATENNTCISFIARSGDKVAGIGSVAMREQPGNFKNPSGKWGYVMNMYTAPEFRKRGICREILNLLVGEASKYGVTAFELHATPAGERVYTREGFLYHDEPTLRKWI